MYGIALRLLGSGSSPDTETTTEVVDYLVDPSSDFGQESAQLFVDMGLLPGWELLAPFKLSHPMREDLAAFYGADLSAERLQEFKTEHQAAIQELNSFVRADLQGSQPTNYPGVSFLGRSEQQTDVESDQATTLLVFGGTPGLESSEHGQATRFFEQGEAWREAGAARKLAKRARYAALAGRRPRQRFA
ncbi:MAG: hypothetical protein ACI9VR_002502 [Cognaticolwellia sp.]